MHHLAQKLLLGLVSFAFTAVVFMNTYEVAFNRDIAFAQSLNKIAAQSVINSTVTGYATKTGVAQSKFVSNLENPQALNIPALKVRTQIEESRKVDNLWYARPSFGHFIELNKDAQNTPVDYLIYCQQSWRTIPKASQIDVGMDVEIVFKGDARLTYRVAERKTQAIDRPLVLDKSENRQIILIVEDPASGVLYGFSLMQEV
jgi:hypothetical protein